MTKETTKNYYDTKRGAGWVPRRLHEINRLIAKYEALTARLIAERTKLACNYPVQSLGVLDDPSDYDAKLKDTVMYNLLAVGSIAAKFYPEINMEELLNKRKLDPFENLNDDWA